MAIAQHNTVFNTLSIQNAKSIEQIQGWKPVQLAIAIVQRAWWHTHGYGTIFAILIMSLVSLIFLSVHWSYRKLLTAFTLRMTNNNEWDISSKQS